MTYQLEPQPPSICWIAVCEHCQRTHISALRAFPTPYVCAACADRLGLRKAWLSTHSYCRNGHALSEATVRWNAHGRGKHECRICARAREAARTRRERRERA